MAKLLSTIWALFLNTLGVSIFQTCFANALEDEDGEPLVSGPPVTSFLFASGVYTVIVKSCIFPSSFRRPRIAVMCLYEFLATAFLLEFSVACIWTPIDMLILTTLPKKLCRLMTTLGFSEVGDWILVNKYPMAMLSYTVALGFFFLALHVTRSVDFSVFTDCGLVVFLRYIKGNLWQKVLEELPRSNGQRDVAGKASREEGAGAAAITTAPNLLHD